MAHTLGYLRLNSAHGGRGPVMAYGTVAAIGDAGSFAVQLDSGGSRCLRDVTAAFLTQNGTVAAVPQATGSSNGYVTVDINRMGSFVLATPGGTLDMNFVVFGGSGSLPF